MNTLLIAILKLGGAGGRGGCVGIHLENFQVRIGQLSLTLAKVFPSTVLDPLDLLDLLDPLEPLDSLDPLGLLNPLDSLDPLGLLDPLNPLDSLGLLDPLDPLDTLDPLDPVDPLDPLDPLHPLDPLVSSGELELRPDQESSGQLKFIHLCHVWGPEMGSYLSLFALALLGPVGFWMTSLYAFKRFFAAGGFAFSNLGVDVHRIFFL